MGKPLGFISCGQFSEEEKELGLAIVEMIDGESPYEAYFAENQNTLEGLSSNILSALGRAAAFVGVMHHRGEIQTPDGPLVRRGSVWVEQEVAIAAFIQNALKRPIVVALYLQKGISLEGIRQQLRLKPFEFDAPEQVLADLRQKVRTWTLDAQPTVDLQFASEDRRQPIGRRIELSTERWTLPDDLPDRESGPLGGLMNDPPTVKAVAQYHAERAETASFAFLLRNCGDEPLRNAKAEINVAKSGDDFHFVDASETPEEPRGSRFGLNLSTPTFNLPLRVESLRDVWRIEVDFGTVSPKATVYVDGLYVYARRTMVIPIEVEVFADNLRTPVRVPMDISVAVTERTISNYDVAKLIGAAE